jgi:hypothetical protein
MPKHRGIAALTCTTSHRADLVGQSLAQAGPSSAACAHPAEPLSGHHPGRPRLPFINPITGPNPAGDGSCSFVSKGPSMITSTTRSADAAGTRTELHRSHRSISDDDLCSCCSQLRYSPGGISRCSLAGPGDADEDGYIVQCQALASCPTGANIHNAQSERRLPC